MIVSVENSMSEIKIPNVLEVIQHPSMMPQGCLKNNTPEKNLGHLTSEVSRFLFKKKCVWFPRSWSKTSIFWLGFYMEVHPPGLPMIHHPIVNTFSARFHPPGRQGKRCCSWMFTFLGSLDLDVSQKSWRWFAFSPMFFLWGIKNGCWVFFNVLLLLKKWDL